MSSVFCPIVVALPLIFAIVVGLHFLCSSGWFTTYLSKVVALPLFCPKVVGLPFFCAIVVDLPPFTIVGYFQTVLCQHLPNMVDFMPCKYSLL